ncbi:MAG: acyltransferase family protein [Deltaproteobacteria bacterium]|nr:acyltransferase family protein [Deltaproteobacteria bacterium]
MPIRPPTARRLTQLLGGKASLARADRLRFPDLGHGFDRFGLSPEFAALGDLLGGPAYEHYFRVRSQGHQHIPTTGPAVLAGNHSGTLPFDAMMTWVDVFRHTDPPRVPRPLADHFVTTLPIISTLFARAGVVGGSRGNADALLASGEILMVFPEGTEGISKPWSERYQLRGWTRGHAELAIRNRAPVVPFGLVGAEEQMPQLAQLPLPGPLPYLPIPATLLPLPVRYHLRYGAPIEVSADYRAEDADDPAAVAALAERVAAAVAALLAEGLAAREGVFA